jgi:hypothetical protein
MKYFAWDDAKNAKLQADRDIGFENVIFHIERGDLLDILEHPNPDRYAGQRIVVIRCGPSRLRRAPRAAFFGVGQALPVR